MLDDFGAFTFKCFILAMEGKSMAPLTEQFLEGSFFSFIYGVMKVCSEDKKKRLEWMMPQSKQKFSFGELYDIIYDMDLEETKIYLSELVRRLGINTINPLKDPPEKIELCENKDDYSVKSFLASMFLTKF